MHPVLKTPCVVLSKQEVPVCCIQETDVWSLATDALTMSSSSAANCCHEAIEHHLCQVYNAIVAAACTRRKLMGKQFTHSHFNSLGREAIQAAGACRQLQLT